MNKEWSEMNKKMQTLIGKEATFPEGIDALIHAIKAMSLFIARHGKKDLQAVLENLHKKQEFEKIQEVLGDDIDQGVQILEENRC